MTDELKLRNVRSVFDTLKFPITRAAASEAVAGVTVLYADGREPLAAAVERSGQDEFETAADLAAEVFANAPIEAVGEPGQSEGEG